MEKSINLNINFLAFKTAKNASKLRRDNRFQDVDLLPDDAGYHRKCYQRYTNPKSFPASITSSATSKYAVKRKRDQPTILAPKHCIICRTERCNKKGKTGYEPLLTCETDAAACALRDFASTCPDIEAEFAGLSISEITAKEFKYHRTCYRTLSSTKEPAITKSKKEIEEDNFRESCFHDIVEYVQDYIIDKGNVVKMSFLTETYHTLQKEKNIPIKGTDNRLLKNRLKRNFGDNLSFFQKGQGKADLVYSDVFPRKIKSRHFEQKIKEVASLLREEIQSFQGVFDQWPPESRNVRAENVKLPNLLEMLLKLILRSNPCNESDRLKRLVKSIGQDILFNATNGRTKTVKHVQLGMFLRRKTGSKEIVTCLNRLGHSLNYDELLRLETNIAEKESSLSSIDYIPSQIEKENFVTYVYDNCDHNPETLSGVSMHCTNGIMIQRPSNPIAVDDTKFKAEQTPKETTMRRSFTPVNTSVYPYKKPKDRPTPQLLDNVIVENNLFSEMVSKAKHWIWLLARYQSVQLLSSQIVPGWSGFNSETIDDSFKAHKVSFLPAINQSPTKMDTVHEVLKQVKRKSELLNVQSADLVLDHAIFTKAFDILNDPANADLKSVINIRMGGFHACCIFLAVIGKRFASGGLKDIVIESGLVGSGTIESVLKGKQYNYGIRMIKIVAESLFRLKIDAFIEWLIERGEEAELHRFLNSTEMTNLIKRRNQKHLQNMQTPFESINNLLIQFDEEISHNSFGPTAQYWQSFLDMAYVLLDYIRSFRIGDWQLHMSSMEKMLVWFHAYDRINYARHFTHCFASLQNLNETHPSILDQFQRGNFATKRTNGAFNMLPPDQVIEQTVNKEQKGPGGIIGISTSIGCVQRWVFSSHIIAEWSQDFKSSIGFEENNSMSKDAGKKRINTDESMVISCCEIIEHWQNPFIRQDKLIALSSGAVANDDVMEDMINAESIGKQSLEQFVEERIVSGTTSFHGTIKKKNLKTFDSLRKKKVFNVKEEQVPVKADRDAFARLLIIQRNRGVDLEEVLQYELSSQPLSLSKPDGSMNKTMKSKLFNHLVQSLSILDDCPLDVPSIYDGMVLLQKLPPNLGSFGEVSDYLLNKVIGGTASTNFFVTDYYLDDSIKSLERQRRSAIGTIRVQALRRDQRKPLQFKKYLQNSENKTELVKFLVKDWSTNQDNLIILNGMKIF